MEENFQKAQKLKKVQNFKILLEYRLIYISFRPRLFLSVPIKTISLVLDNHWQVGANGHRINLCIRMCTTRNGTAILDISTAHC